MQDRNVVLIGPMPPPIGGVSTHLSRLLLRSREEDKLNLSVLDIRRLRLHSLDGSSRNLFSLLICLLRADIIHVHISRKFKLFLVRFSKICGKKVVYTHHNSRNLNEALTLRTMKSVDQVILVRPLQEKFPTDIQEKCTVIPAYLHAHDSNELPAELISQFTEDIVLFAHCYQRKPDPILIDGKDLYGFDVILKALDSIMLSQPDLNLLLFLADPADAMKEYYSSHLLALTRFSKLKIIYWNKQLNFSSALKHSTMLIRATRSEGDAISVREALQSGVPVLASNCVQRPEGVITFETGDHEALAAAIIKQIGSPAKKLFPQPDFAPEIFKIYNSI